MNLKEWDEKYLSPEEREEIYREFGPPVVKGGKICNHPLMNCPYQVFSNGRINCSEMECGK